MNTFTRKLFRTKVLERDIMKTELKRCLSTMDLTLIGIGSMVGGGMYVLLGSLLRNTTGPATVLSFLIAGLVSGLSAWCYAEFGARVPKAGSAYIYTYLTVGELAAFVIGWNLVLEHVIGVAAVARCFMGYVNEVSNNFFHEKTPDSLVEHGFDPYPVVVLMLVAILVCSGVKESIVINNLLCFVNISVALFVIAGGIYFSNATYWTSPDGFMPFGFSSIFKGSAKAYFAFVGYDSVAIACEEARDPSFSVPFALAFDVIFVTILYCSTSSALTMTLPYTAIDRNAAFAAVFDQKGWPWAKYVVSTGAIGAMACVILAFLFTMPRCIYAMASDGLIFKKLSQVNSTTKVPVYATVLGSLASCIFAFFLSMDDLVDFMSIGTLLAYMIVALALIVLRYLPQDVLKNNEINDGGCRSREESRLLRSKNQLKPKQVKLLTAMIILIVAMNTLIAAIEWVPQKYLAIIYVLTGIIFLLLALVLITLSVISEDSSESTYCRVPFVPFLPALSIAANCYLMTQLGVMTWLRLAAWMTAGFIIYFLYGIKNSMARDMNDSNHWHKESPQYSHNGQTNEHSGEFSPLQNFTDSE